MLRFLKLSPRNEFEISKINEYIIHERDNYEKSEHIFDVFSLSKLGQKFKFFSNISKLIII